jgi:hypothetical protein
MQILGLFGRAESAIHIDLAPIPIFGYKLEHSPNPPAPITTVPQPRTSLAQKTPTPTLTGIKQTKMLQKHHKQRQ